MNTPMHASTENCQINSSDKSEKQEIKQINWSQVLGNPYRYGLHPDMLQPDGYRYKGLVKIVGQKAQEAPIPVIVTFDEQYVISYLRTYVLEKLLPTSYNDFQKVISKVWQSWQQK